jgi:hypothetical protein
MTLLSHRYTWRYKMTVIAFHFTKIAGERKPGNIGKASIKNQTQLTDVREEKVGTQKALTFSFSHKTLYEPVGANITIEGEVVALSNDKEVQETLASYKKNKSFNPDLMERVYNSILSRATVQTLLVAKDLNLPAPFKLPRLEIKPAGTSAAAQAKPAPKKK